MSAEHDQLQSSLAGFILGATEADEAELVRAHLEGCSSCQELAWHLQRALNGMPLAVELEPPPARLPVRILAEAGVSRQSGRARPDRARILRPPRPRQAPRIWTALPRISARVAAAAVVAFGLGAGLGLSIGRGLASQPTPGAVAQHSLAGTGSMSGTQGRVFELKQEGLTLVQFTGLPQPAQGKIYELWLIPRSGQPAPAGVFAPDPEGSQLVVVARNMHGLMALAVTEEVAPNGASAPTQQPQLSGLVGSG